MTRERTTMKASLAAASLLTLTLASPCMAADTDPITSLLRNTPTTAIYDLVENADLQSMTIDAAFVTVLHINSVDASPPPARYDRPYRGELEIVDDVTAPSGTPFQDGELIGWAEPDRRNHRCVIHVPPLWHGYVSSDEIWVVDPISREKIIRHERGHCNGGILSRRNVRPMDRRKRDHSRAHLSGATSAAARHHPARLLWRRLLTESNATTRPARRPTATQ
jgi:hypothetical protein